MNKFLAAPHNCTAGHRFNSVQSVNNTDKLANCQIRSSIF